MINGLYQKHKYTHTHAHVAMVQNNIEAVCQSPSTDVHLIRHCEINQMRKLKDQTQPNTWLAPKKDDGNDDDDSRI